jgi:hypothetical protein
MRSPTPARVKWSPPTNLGAEETWEVTLAEVRRMVKDFPAVWEALTLEERRETLRLLVESLKVYRTHAELKLLFLDPVQIPLDFRRGRNAQAAVTA